MEKPWKSHLQEYCQKKKLPSPNYRIRQQTGLLNKPKFQVEVDVDGRWYIGEENCSSKKEAENSAAEKACLDLMREVFHVDGTQTDQIVDDNDPSKHFPPEYADIEEFFATMVGAFGARIRKIRPPRDTRGIYRVEIVGDYRYCNNIQQHHKKNQVYFLVDPKKKIYYQKCYDPECQGFQSRGYRDLFFWDLFFQRNYLFLEDLLTVSRFPHTLTLTLPPVLTLTLTFALTLTFGFALTLNIVWDLF